MGLWWRAGAQPASTRSQWTSISMAMRQSSLGAISVAHFGAIFTCIYLFFPSATFDSDRHVRRTCTYSFHNSGQGGSTPVKAELMTVLLLPVLYPTHTNNFYVACTCLDRLIQIQMDTEFHCLDAEHTVVIYGSVGGGGCLRATVCMWWSEDNSLLLPCESQGMNSGCLVATPISAILVFNWRLIGNDHYVEQLWRFSERR